MGLLVRQLISFTDYALKGCSGRGNSTITTSGSTAQVRGLILGKFLRGRESISGKQLKRGDGIPGVTKV
jgi:hypothetical protein